MWRIPAMPQVRADRDLTQVRPIRWTKTRSANGFDRRLSAGGVTARARRIEGKSYEAEGVSAGTARGSGRVRDGGPDRPDLDGFDPVGDRPARSLRRAGSGRCRSPFH